MKAFLKKSKSGITLVEAAISVALLGFAVTGILSMLLVSGTKIYSLGDKSATYAEATQRLDLIISTISNSNFASSSYTDKYGTEKTFISANGALNPQNVLEALELDDCTLEMIGSPIEYPGTETDPVKKIRGWYLRLTYDKVTVQGFVSYTEGSFDKLTLKTNTGGSSGE